MPPKMTHDEFIAKLTTQNPNIEVLGHYVNSSTHIACRCKIDGYEWNPTPNKLLQGRGCPRCAKKEPYSESFERRIRETFPNITLISEFKSGDEKVRCRCNIDGYEWDVVPYGLMKTSGCPKCAGNMRWTHEDFVQRVHQHNPHVVVMGQYVNSYTAVHCKCERDGYEWNANSRHLMDGVNCPMCAGVAHKTHETFIEEMNQTRPQVKVVGRYQNNHTKIECQCLICGANWMATPNALLRHKVGCPSCGKVHSSGEQKISCYLTNRNISFVSQYCFNDCADKKKLRFDFYVPAYNIAIEYDGKQHFTPTNFGGMSDDHAYDAYVRCAKHDQIKTEYCKNNNITLIRIPYTEFDEIENILDKYLL